MEPFRGQVLRLVSGGAEEMHAQEARREAEDAKKGQGWLFTDKLKRIERFSTLSKQIPLLRIWCRGA